MHLVAERDRPLRAMAAAWLLPSQASTSVTRALNVFSALLGTIGGLVMLSELSAPLVVRAGGVFILILSALLMLLAVVQATAAALSSRGRYRAPIGVFDGLARVLDLDPSVPGLPREPPVVRAFARVAGLASEHSGDARFGVFRRGLTRLSPGPWTIDVDTGSDNREMKAIQPSTEDVVGYESPRRSRSERPAKVDATTAARESRP